VELFSLVKRLEERIHPVPLKDRIMQARSRLSIQKEGLESMASKIQQKDRDLFQRCVGAEMSKDMAHGRLYANECAEVRKIAQVVLSSQLALEQVILRLDTILEFGELMTDMRPIVGVVQETKGRISGIVPHVPSELEQINSMLSDLGIETGPVIEGPAQVETTGQEARRVLEESSAIAAERVAETFPKLPEVAIQHRKVEEQPLLAAGPERDVEGRLYNFIKDHQGNLHISEATFALGESPTRIKEAVDRLTSEGRIVIE
jgi:division protein CdvB (Snf7/Vps24/ESCRT-III family)